MVSINVDMTTILVVLATTLFVLAVMMAFVVSSRSLDREKDIKYISRMCLIGYGVLILATVGLYTATVLGFAKTSPILLSILVGIGLGFVLAAPFAALTLLARIPLSKEESATEGKQLTSIEKKPAA